MFKRYLPRSLLGRSLLIIVTPLIVLQVVTAWIFYDRHWDTITRRLTDAIAGEIGLIVDTMRRYSGPEDQKAIIDMSRRLGLQITFYPKDILTNKEPIVGSDRFNAQLMRSLKANVKRPVHIDSQSIEDRVRIAVQVPEGVVDVIVPRKRLFSSTTYIFVIWMVGTSMVLFAVAMLFMRNQISPITRLAAAVDGFGKGRDVPNFKPEGALEIRQAAIAFNRMRGRIQTAIAQRTEMLAGVSHDLRTPLTRMKLQLAMQKPGQGVEELNSDVVDMEKMVEEYLAFARGEGTEEVETIDIARTLDEVVKGARGAEVPIELEMKGDLVVPVRPNAVKRCLTNLVSNATRYGERVQVLADRRGDSIEVTVDDDGPGIPEAEREAVFKPFYRLDGSRNPATGGTGLGLTIARDVVRGHGGELALEDSPLGGVRARLRLPV